MQFLNRLYGWYGKRVVWGFFAAVAVLVLVGIVLKLAGGPAEITETNTTPLVIVRAVRDIGNGTSFDVVGTVTSVHEARLRAEAAGRVTDVRVEVGDRVSPGTVLATIENASQAAAVLQAEGSYEAALAAAATSEVSEASAETALTAALESAQNTYRSAYISADSAVRGTADRVISNPRGRNPGLTINGFGRAPQLSEMRVEIESVLSAWSRDLDTVSSQSVEALLPEAQERLSRISQFIEELALIVDRQQQIDMSATEKATLQASFLSARTTLSAQQSALVSARTGIENAEEALVRAQIAASNDVVSAASAQVKQALGTLRAAQAAYEKTIVRSPIAGAINALYLKEGTYASLGMDAALVANNGSLEISTSVSEEESARIRVGDPVTIEHDTNGTVTAIAPAIDPQTGKVSVKIGVADARSIENGTTVRVTFTLEQKTDAHDTILIPLTALKIFADESVVFRVTDDHVLESIPVTLGPVRGDRVEITDGLTPDTHIVTDARGLKAGDRVEVQ